ncbi:MAG: NAD-dependent epimerase/dehydratase family protein [Spirochaetales bacterium]|nr:NAD-dependent epimerase/dehydratase family protein [Spirochaetales bacterium]
MRVVLIGATGHIGSYLVPRLIEAGHSVTAISRGKSSPYFSHPAWKGVKQLSLDREELEKRGEFGQRIAQEEGDVVIDLICFTRESAAQLVEALEGKVQHFISCGSIWVHGPSIVVPTTEAQPRAPIGEYGEGKAQIEEYLLEKARRDGFPATIIHPGHIVGPGWNPLNPQGHFNNAVWGTIKRGEKLTLPNLGLETLNHVHADDLAQIFMLSIENYNQAVGESFHATAERAVTLRGFAEWSYRYYGHEPNLEFLPVEELADSLSDEDAFFVRDHLYRSPNCSIAKAQRLLNYAPRYTTFQAIEEALVALEAKEEI